MRLALLISAIAALGLAGVIALMSATSPSITPKDSAFEFNENSDEIKQLMLDAVNGSGDAAVRLVNLYGHCHKTDPSEARLAECIKSLNYWTRVAVENGSHSGILYHIDDLMATGRCIDASRAEFWLNRLREKRQLSPARLSSLGMEISSAKRSCT